MQETAGKKQINIALACCSFVLILAFIFFGAKWALSDQKTGSEHAYTASVSNSVMKTDIKKEQSYDLSASTSLTKNRFDISAQSAISVETNLFGKKNVLYDKNTSSLLPIASLTKLMTAVVALQSYDMSKTAIIGESSIKQEGKQGSLVLGDTMSVNELLYVMLIESSNQAAYAISEIMSAEKFVSLMNAKAKELGLENTYFQDPTGLSSQNYSSAQDLANLAEYILRDYPLIFDITKTKELDLYKQDGTFYGKLESTDELLGELPGIVGGKTGFTWEANGCLLIVRDLSTQFELPQPADVPLLNPLVKKDYAIYVILGADDRFGQMRELIRNVELENN